MMTKGRKYSTKPLKSTVCRPCIR